MARDFANESSPRSWGCFPADVVLFAVCIVFPTLVGVFLEVAMEIAVWWRLPHARGGVSFGVCFRRDLASSSPRSWGCFYPLIFTCCSEYVFPTLVGVFPMPLRPALPLLRLPHARGGVSGQRIRQTACPPSSPRSWGCFRIFAALWSSVRVFPTLVGVFLEGHGLLLHDHGLPHARGGVSEVLASRRHLAKSSPRSWGCFFDAIRASQVERVFPTLVGVFPVFGFVLWSLLSLPHARGGVSLTRNAVKINKKSSPRSWGCFPSRNGGLFYSFVFPTLVGVFLFSRIYILFPARLPHARGGVSLPCRTFWRLETSSPRSWGCFPVPEERRCCDNVFPTLVGVFPPGTARPPRPTGLPHARGGVSLPAPRMTQRRKSSPRSWGCCQDSLLHGGLSVRSGSYSMSCVLIQKR